MDITEFAQLVDDLFEFFGKEANKPSEKQLAGWYEKVKPVSSLAINHIRTHIEDNNKSLSRQVNLPRLIWRAFHAWRSANPDHAAVHPKTPCGECDGKGLVWFYLTDDSGCEYQTHGCCGKCANWKRHFNDPKVAGPKVSKSILEFRGYKLAYPQAG